MLHSLGCAKSFKFRSADDVFMRSLAKEFKEGEREFDDWMKISYPDVYKKRTYLRIYRFISTFILWIAIGYLAHYIYSNA